MNRDDKKKIERILYKHYKKVRKVDRLKRRKLILDHKLKQIDKDIRECNIEIKSYIQGISYESLGEQISQGIESPVEIMILKEIENLQRDYEKHYKERASVKRRIWDIEKKIIDIGIILEYVCKKDEDYEKIIQMKYSDEFSNVKIGRLINSSEASIRRKLHFILKKVMYEI